MFTYKFMFINIIPIKSILYNISINHLRQSLNILQEMISSHYLFSLYSLETLIKYAIVHVNIPLESSQTMVNNHTEQKITLYQLTKYHIY